jgi:hypothetical protein
MYVLKFVLHMSGHLLAAMTEVISVFSLARKAYPITILQIVNEYFPSSLFHFKTHATSLTLLTLGHLNNTNKICATQRTSLLNSQI